MEACDCFLSFTYTNAYPEAKHDYLTANVMAEKFRKMTHSIGIVRRDILHSSRLMLNI